MGLFSKEECVFCGKSAGFFGRKRLVNNEGYICKDCENKCSSLINVGRFTKEELKGHMEYMEKQNKIYEEAFEGKDKKNIDRFVCISTGVEFVDEIAMFRYLSPNADKKENKELFRYDQIKSYEPYMIANTNSQGGKKYSEVGIIIHLYSSWTPDMKQYKDNRSFHPYVTELKVPVHRNVDDFTGGPLKNKLDKLFGVYEDNSVFGSIKSSIVGTNKQREQAKVAAEGLKALGSLAKAKMSGNEDDEQKAKENLDVLKNDALDLATGNRASYTKIANDVEDQILNK